MENECQCPVETAFRIIQIRGLGIGISCVIFNYANLKRHSPEMRILDVEVVDMRHTQTLFDIRLRNTCGINVTHMRHTCDVHAQYIRRVGFYILATCWHIYVPLDMSICGFMNTFILLTGEITYSKYRHIVKSQSCSTHSTKHQWSIFWPCHT